MMRIVFLFQVLLTSTSVLANISQSNYENCQKLTDSLIRLRCYDTLKPIATDSKNVPSKVVIPAVSVPLSVPEVPVPNSPLIANKSIPGYTENRRKEHDSLSMGKWQVTEKILNSRGEIINTATATLLANSGATDTAFLPLLTVHCNGTKTKTSINWGEPINKIRQVKIFIGDEQFHSRRWNLSKRKDISFYPNPSPYFLKQMSNNNKFEISLLLRKGEKKSANFDTTGMRQAIKPIRAACDW